MRARHLASSMLAAVLLSIASSVRAEPGASTTTNDSNLIGALSGASYCAGANPSCGRDPWWLQWNEIQNTDLVSFAVTRTPMTVESRYVEALQVLWSWDEGEDLLTQGSEFGVSVRSGIFETEPTAIASYSTSRRTIQINPRYARAATWMLAAVISHELRHISDARNRLFQSHISGDCLTRETRAYETEGRFMAWYTEALVGERLPVQELRQRVPSEYRGLSELLLRINTAPDASELVRKDYAELCESNP
ncbi:MAG TPA: hypothetical protein VHX16_12385 [Chloroflexota bacterium]|nr:hypothetical protein [Chloroflexota bacterium]